jgi:hypothetical protein
MKTDAGIAAVSPIVIKKITLPENVRHVSEWPAISLCAVTTEHLAPNDKHIRRSLSASIIRKAPLRWNVGYLLSDVVIVIALPVYPVCD